MAAAAGPREAALRLSRDLAVAGSPEAVAALLARRPGDVDGAAAAAALHRVAGLRRGGARAAGAAGILREVERRLGELPPGGVVGAAWACAVLQERSPPLLAALSEQVLSRAGELGPQRLANAAWCVAALRREDAPLLDGLAEACAARAGDLRPQELSNVAWAFAKLRGDRRGCLASVFDAGAGRVGEFKPQEVANLLWASAAIRWHDNRHWDALAGRAGAVAAALRPQELAATLWAFAALAAPPLDALSAEALRRLAEFDLRNIANVAWALARLVVEHDAALVASAAQATLARLPGAAEPQALANTAWACARLVVDDAGVLASLLAAAQPVVRHFKAQEFANLVWAFATLTFPHDEIYAALPRAFLARFAPRHLANTAWSFAVCAAKDEKVVAELSALGRARAAEFDAQDLASTAWSFATMARCDEPLLHVLAAGARATLPQFSPQALGNTAWAFATLQVLDEALLDGVSAEARRQAPRLGSQELANLAWAFATFRWPDAPLMAALGAAASGRLAEFRPQELAGLAWSWARLAMDDAPLLAAVAAATERGLDAPWGAQELANVGWALARLRAAEAPLLGAMAARLLPAVQRGGALPRHAEMLLWSLSRLDGLDEAWAFRARVKACGWEVGRLAAAGLLSRCEGRGALAPGGGERELLLDLAAPGTQVAAAAARAAAERLAEAGLAEEALATLQGAAPGLDASSEALWRALGARAPPTAPLPPGSKEARLVAFVLATAPRGDPAAACAAIEAFGRDSLARPHGGAGGRAPSAGRWLKVAGGEKARVLLAAARLAPGGASPRFLEVGAYCGYSALRLSLARPGARILSLEADPWAAVLARAVLAHAGLAHLATVRIGHSEDVLPEVCRGAPFDLAFFDQRGSRYCADLAALEAARALRPGAVLLADNVLKPGAPAFLWRVVRGGDFETRIVAMEEHAMPGVEDWMSLSVRLAAGAPAPAPPPELRRLEWEADRIRARAEQGGVTFRAWAEFVAGMRERLLRLGLGPT